MRRFLADNQRWVLVLGFTFVIFVVACGGVLHFIGPTLPPRDVADREAYAAAFWGGLYSALIAGVITSLFTGLFVGIVLFTLQSWSERRTSTRREHLALLLDLFRTIEHEDVMFASLNVAGRGSAYDVRPSMARAIEQWEEHHLSAGDWAVRSVPEIWSARLTVAVMALNFKAAADRLDSLCKQMTNDYIAAHNAQSLAEGGHLHRYVLGCLECNLTGNTVDTWGAVFAQREQLADAPATLAKLGAVYQEMVDATPELETALDDVRRGHRDYYIQVTVFYHTLHHYLQTNDIGRR
jgi:hypothetical protein